MWFQEMANDGVKPEFVVLFAAFGLQVDYAVSKQEAAIIRFFVDHGCDLVNEFHHPHRKEWRRRTRKSA